MLIRKGRDKMKLKSIRAYGFKSFADKMEMEFKTNITAIVGPNGSGKSNIVDAIRWVLGEQSVKSLRGSSSMSDVIFKGSETRAPFKRCEVALTFDNEDHFLNTDLEEVEIKRVLYYTGENEYFINNTKVRLKDVTNILLDSGMGSDAYNIISQGNIEAIVNSKPLERRVILESAAQVLKYKNRKNESLRKLEKTKDNLEKVDLIIKELETTVLPLKEQSVVAKKYLELEKDLQNLEISLTVHDLTDIHDRFDELVRKREKLTDERASLNTKNSSKSSVIQKLELTLLDLENKIEEENAHYLSLNERIHKLQNEKTLLQERQKYEISEEKINENLMSLKEEESRLEKERATFEREIAKIEESLQNYEKDLQEIDEELTVQKLKYQKFHQEYENQIHEELVMKNRISILENTMENDPNYSAAIKNVLNHPRLKGIHNTIGHLLEVPSEYSTAIDVALASSANFIVVDTTKNAEEAIHYLKENKLGRATFFPLDTIKSRLIPESILQMVQKSSGFIGVASDLLSFESKYRDIMENQLGQVLVVKDFSSLEEVGKLINHKYRIVTLDGEISHVGGSLTGGSLKKSTSSLSLKAEISTLRKNLERLEETLINDRKTEEEFLEQVSSLEEKRKDILLQKNVFLDSLGKKEREKHALDEKLEAIALDIASDSSLKEGSLDESFAGLMKTITEAEIARDASEKKLEEYKVKKSEVSSQISELEMENKKFSSLVYQIDQSLKECEIDMGKMETQMDYMLTLLSETYHLTYEKAKMDYVLDLDSEIARFKVSSLRKEMKSLGTVNLGSIDEFERLNTRYEFLKNQKDDLEKACTDLLEIISEMDEIMITRLQDAFAKIQAEFSKVFHKMFKGGTGNLILTDPDNILETGIDIVAEPPGKKLNNIQLLSGGEKTLTAISLLFAILNVYPVPFCVLDEVEAALDEANVDTFGKYLQEQKDKSEFILITHKKRTMEYADTLYGITMQEQGVSKVVSVKLEGQE